jgi:hypothetical protein
LTTQSDPYEALGPVPVSPPHDAVLILRDSLRDLFALLDIDASVVAATTEGTRRSIVIEPLSLGDARGTCVHLGVRTGQTCPRCRQLVGAPAPAPTGTPRAQSR